MDVTIRQATLQDRERIGQFLQAAYGERAVYKFPARWLWLFVNNPFWDGARLPVWLAEVDGQIVGQTCEMVVRLKLGDRAHPAAWGVDYIVLPGFRRQGIGRLLQQAQAEYHDNFMALSMSPISRRVLADMGFAEANAAVEVHKTIRLSPDQAQTIVQNKLGTSKILSSVCGMRYAAPALAAIFSLFTRLRALGRPHPGWRTTTLVRIEHFDDETDQLWARLAPRFPVIVQRNAAYLNWKFVQQPDMRYDKFLVRREGVACGYVITRTGIPPEARIGIIADLFAAPDDDVVIRHLLRHAIRHLAREGVNGIIAASSVPEYVAHLLQQGFRITRDVIPMFRSRALADTPLSGWYLSMGDHDWDQYPLTIEAQPHHG